MYETNSWSAGCCMISSGLAGGGRVLAGRSYALKGEVSLNSLLVFGTTTYNLQPGSGGRLISGAFQKDWKLANVVICPSERWMAECKA